MRSTRYSWLGVISRYWTIEFKVGIDDDFITAACFRLLMLVSGGEKKQSIYEGKVSIVFKKGLNEFSFFLENLIRLLVDGHIF